MDRHLNICLSRESSEIGEIRLLPAMIGDTAPQHKAGHRPPLSEEPGQCTEKDWSHPEQRVIKYLEYNTVRKYSTSSIITISIQCKVKKVERIYNDSSCDKSTHLISATGQPAGVKPG